MTHTGRRRRKVPRVAFGVDLGEFFTRLFVPEDLAPAEPGEPSIRTMQLRLRALGLFEGAVDGRPSEPLAAAVRRFQKLSGMRASGDVHDAQTRLLLRDAVRGAAAAGRKPAAGDRWPR